MSQILQGISMFPARIDIVRPSVAYFSAYILSAVSIYIADKRIMTSELAVKHHAFNQVFI